MNLQMYKICKEIPGTAKTACHMLHLPRDSPSNVAKQSNQPQHQVYGHEVLRVPFYPDPHRYKSGTKPWALNPSAWFWAR